MMSETSPEMSPETCISPLFPTEILCVICDFHPNGEPRFSNIIITNKRFHELHRKGVSFILSQEKIFKSLHTEICSNKHDEISYTQFHNIMVITRSLCKSVGDEWINQRKVTKCSNAGYPGCSSIREIRRVHDRMEEKKNKIYTQLIRKFVIKWHFLFSRIIDALEKGDIRITTSKFDFESNLYA